MMNSCFFIKIKISSSLATVKITSINDGVITTSTAYFKNLQSVYKINFTGLGSGLKIKKMTIQSEKNRLVYRYNPLDISGEYDQFSNVSYIYQEGGTDQRELTFLLRFANNPYMQQSTSGDVITFRALGSDDHNYSGTKAVTNDLENGKYYHADVAMTDGGLAMKVTNITTGVTLDYPALYTKDADYLAENNGYGTCIEWYGGNDYNHTLTIKDLNMNNGRDGAIAVKTDEDDPNNTKFHKLVLDGVNTLSVTGDHTSITVQNNCSLIISSTSTGTGKLILKAENGHALNVWDNGQLTIESGEVTVDGSLGIGDNSSCIITNSGKLRVLTQKLYSASGIKAADNYALIVSQDGDYSVYTVVEDDGSGIAKSIVVTPATATLYYDSYDFSGIDLNVSVYPENTKNKSVTWKTKDPNVVEVDENGNVEAVGLGNTWITATTKNGVSADCPVLVYHEHKLTKVESTESTCAKKSIKSMTLKKPMNACISTVTLSQKIWCQFIVVKKLKLRQIVDYCTE